MSIPRPNLPADARLETLAVRDGLPASRWGENSEALYLTSCFVHPDAATAAARFANEEDNNCRLSGVSSTTRMVGRSTGEALAGATALADGAARRVSGARKTLSAVAVALAEARRGVDCTARVVV